VVFEKADEAVRVRKVDQEVQLFTLLVSGSVQVRNGPKGFFRACKPNFLDFAPYFFFTNSGIPQPTRGIFCIMLIMKQTLGNHPRLSARIDITRHAP
jgi:hypothetical protein